MRDYAGSNPCPTIDQPPLTRTKTSSIMARAEEMLRWTTATGASKILQTQTEEKTLVLDLCVPKGSWEGSLREILNLRNLTLHISLLSSIRVIRGSVVCPKPSQWLWNVVTCHARQNGLEPLAPTPLTHINIVSPFWEMLSSMADRGGQKGYSSTFSLM